MRALLFILSLLNAPLLAEETRIPEGPSVDISRTMEAKEVAYHIGCSKGIKADTTVTCSLVKRVGDTIVRQSKISSQMLDSILGEFFASVPNEEMHEKKSSGRTDDVRWQINFNERSTAGIARHEHSPGTEQEKLWREAMRKALFMLQDSFELHLNFSAAS